LDSSSFSTALEKGGAARKAHSKGEEKIIKNTRHRDEAGSHKKAGLPGKDQSHLHAAGFPQRKKLAGKGGGGHNG